MNRTEIIELIAVRALPDEQRQIRQLLEAKSTEELEKIHLQIVVDATDEKLIEIQAEREANRLWHQHEMRQAREPYRQAQEQTDIAVFKDAASRLKFSMVEANFRVLVSTLGPGLAFESIKNAVTSNAVQLVPPQQQELVQWAREAEEQRRQAAEIHQNYLINRATPAELKQAAKTEAEQSRALAVQEQDQRQIQHREALDAQVGFPPIPETNQMGEKLDSAYFIKLSNTNLQLFKHFIRKHGAANVTARLRGQR